MEIIDRNIIKSILIVDDSSTAQMIIKRCFEISGFIENNYVFASNGLEALDILKNNQIDLVITDLNMPKLNGTNLIKLIKANEKTKNILIVIATSLGDNKAIDDLYSIGIKCVIKKPITPNKIMELFKK